MISSQYKHTIISFSDSITPKNNNVYMYALYETRQTKHGDFENLLPGFVNYDCIRTSSAKRGSGGVTFFC